jgi:osmoprotectant transport system ATP-binding protein
VVRERLQSEFLRLQETVRKTIVFVTHDIEEAVRLGDRIAVMSSGGHVEQFAPPAELLGRPANETVADFVGADRGAQAAGGDPIDPADLEHPPVVALGDGLAEAGAAWTAPAPAGRWCWTTRPPGGWLPADRAAGAGTVASAVVRDDAPCRCRRSLRTALATILQSDAGWVPVLDGDRYLGVLTPAALHAALRRSVTDAPEREVLRRGCLVGTDQARAPACGVSSSGDGGMRQTDSSHSAAATQRGRADHPDDPVTVSFAAACSRDTDGPT